ncbi:MAG: cytochrome c biogenesis protein ResB [Isosphaeraceae bacterium]|nr:cytochrome c biogenesis protein ResB [Isosphaeraceae bacterium]
MANAVQSVAQPKSAPTAAGRPPFAVRAVLAIYRFLASLQLAVISIAALAAVLAYGTWYEREHGTIAVQQDIYQAPFFAIQLAFLAINILCAATIRIPWKRRQLGFVVTHAGLLVLIFGSWYGLWYSDEGQVGAVEGSAMSQLVRTDKPRIRVREIDPEQGRPIDPEYVLAFNGGAFDWEPGRYEVISKKNDPFKLAVKKFYAASAPATRRFADPSGSPMLRIRPMMKPPGASEATDVFSEPEQWLTIPADIRLSRTARAVPPARLVFHYFDRPELVEDFLAPPADPGEFGVVRFRYTDESGKRVKHDVRLDGLEKGKAFPLPGSRITASFLDRKSLPIEDATMMESLGEPVLTFAEFELRDGDRPAIKHTAFAGLPVIPSVIPTADRPAAAALADLCYYLPPRVSVGGGMSGTFGVIEIVGDAQGKLYYRVFGRPKDAGAATAATDRPAVLRAGPAPLPLDESITAFGGENMPMTLTFSALTYFPKGKTERIYEPFEMPIGQKGNGLAAAELEITVDGVTRDFWVQRPPSLDPIFRPVAVGKKIYEVAYDFDRKDLGFSLFLDKFTVDFDPGTSQASSFTSNVRLTDEARKIKDQPVVIWMNNPLTHREYTFYQSSYERIKDPRTGEETGEFRSILQVGHDAGRFLKYSGSLLIVLGTFLQFYMRAGVFSQAGKAAVAAVAGSADRARERLAKLGAKTGSGVESAAGAGAEKPASKRSSEDIL